MLFLKNKKIRFIIAGAGNSAFAYFSTIVLYYILSDNFDLFYIALIAGFINIIFSSLVQKFFVFDSRNLDIYSDIQVLIYYVVLLLSSSYLLNLLVLNLGLTIWISQLLIIVISSIISFNYFNFIYRKS